MLTSPPGPMLAQLDSRLPRGDRWAYEPKLTVFVAGCGGERVRRSC